MDFELSGFDSSILSWEFFTRYRGVAPFNAFAKDFLLIKLNNHPKWISLMHTEELKNFTKIFHINHPC